VITNKGSQVRIRQGYESDAASVCEAVKAIASEKWHLATVDGFSFEQTREFLKRVVDGSLPQVIALVDDKVVGFCDILPNTAKGFTHVGRLGMGVLLEWRGRGIGRRMLDVCLSRARTSGIEKVELEVFSDNVAAVRLYDSFGFTQEGLRVRGRKLEERYQDVSLMAL
jgi:L-phenylalanine/L-methionine N-acetyltransferase